MVATLKKNDCVGFGNKSLVYKVGPGIVMKTVRDQNSKAEEHPFFRELNFYKRLIQQQDRCPDIVQCFLALPDYLFLSYCDSNQIDLRFSEYQEREKRCDGFPGRLLRIKITRILLLSLDGYNKSLQHSNTWKSCASPTTIYTHAIVYSTVI